MKKIPRHTSIIDRSNSLKPDKKISSRNYYATQTIFSWFLGIIICLLLVLNCFNNQITFRGILDELASSNIYSSVQQAFKDSGQFLNIPKLPSGDVPGVSTVIRGINSLLQFLGSLCQLAYCLRAFIIETFKFFWDILSYLLGF